MRVSTFIGGVTLSEAAHASVREEATDADLEDKKRVSLQIGLGSWN